MFCSWTEALELVVSLGCFIVLNLNVTIFETFVNYIRLQHAVQISHAIQVYPAAVQVKHAVLIQPVVRMHH